MFEQDDEVLLGDCSKRFSGVKPGWLIGLMRAGIIDPYQYDAASYG